MTRFFATLAIALLAAGSSLAQVVMRYGPEIDSGWGDASTVVTPYVSFPSSFVGAYAGNRVTRVRIGVCSEGTNVYLYIKNKPADSRYVYRQKLADLQPGWNEITLEEPFEISGTDDIAIGYKASFASAGGVGYSNEKHSDGDIVYYNSKNRWTSTGGSVCIQALVEGDNMPRDEMMVYGLADQTAPYEADSATFRGVVRNVGANDVGSYAIDCTFGGTTKRTEIARGVAVNACDTFEVTVPATDVGDNELAVSISSVNGRADTYAANNTATATLTVLDKRFMRRVVCEEYTGTWCGWCPRGIVGLELMKEKHPSRFIAVSVHGGDALEIDPAADYSYAAFIASCPGAPLCNVNRKFTGDPFADIDRLFAMETATANHIAYKLDAEWNSDSTGIQLRSVYSSDSDNDDAQYSIAYTITEDSVGGYTQANYYAGGKNGYMYGWEEKDELTSDFCYNDLARAIFGGYGGKPCAATAMTGGTEYVETESIPLPPNVADKRNIHVIGQVIDRKTGYIVNAMSVVPVGGGTVGGIAPADNGATGVSLVRKGNCLHVVAAAVGSARLSASLCRLSGQTVATTPVVSGCATLMLPSRGVYIVRVADGKRVLRTFKLSY